MFPTKTLPKLLSALRGRDQSTLVDLGPVVGQNVSFFGEQLGCKLFVEDIFADIDRHVKAGTLEALPGAMASRLSQPSSSVDAVLGWDVFDYLEKGAREALAAEVIRVLRPDGVLLVFFGTEKPVPSEHPVYYKRVVIDQTTVTQTEYPGVCGKRPPLQNRDVNRLFEPLRVTEQFLMKSQVRELLFRKPQV